MLYLIATPIGDTSEISMRALEILKQTETLIVESTKETSRLLKNYEISGKKYELLNEHSTEEDLQALLLICKEKDVALVSDCGTPGFCDPGADLVRLCRKNKIPVKSVLGASSLMGLLSLSSQRIDEFIFRGFIPAESEAREKEWFKLSRENRALILMDTPYRLKKMLAELKLHCSQRKILCVLNLSQENETTLEGTPEHVISQLPFDKAEFMILVYPTQTEFFHVKNKPFKKNVHK